MQRGRRVGRRCDGGLSLGGVDWLWASGADMFRPHGGMSLV